MANTSAKETMENNTATASTDNDHDNSGITAPPIAPANDMLAVFRQLTGINSDPTLKLPANDKPAVSRPLTPTDTDRTPKLNFKDKFTVPRLPTLINSDPALKPTETLGRPASNLGIYGRTVLAESQAERQYKTFSILINACLGIQIIVAAALTALGAGNGPHRLVTGFGAINTIIAGILTYLKGSGLPNRYKDQQNRWRKVREYIEQRERDFCLDRCTLKVKDEIYIIECMYEDARSEKEPSVPNSYGSSKARGRKEENDDLEQGRRAPNPSSPTHVSSRTY